MSVHDEVFTGRSPHLYQGKSETVMLGCLKPREVSEKSFEFLDQLTDAMTVHAGAGRPVFLPRR
jgi:hypothetical protein